MTRMTTEVQYNLTTLTLTIHPRSMQINANLYYSYDMSLLPSRLLNCTVMYKHLSQGNYNVT